MKYYWLKLKSDFFRDLRVKKLRRDPNGAALTLLYLELLLASLATDGALPLPGFDPPVEELSLLLDADEADCAALMEHLLKYGLLEKTPAGGLRLTALEDLTGSETDAAARMRKARAGKKETPANANVPPEQCANNVQHCSAEKEIEKEIEIESELEIEPESEIESELNISPRFPASSMGAEAVFLPTKEKKEFEVGEDVIREYISLYPTLDVKAELRAMRSWLNANPDRRKTPEETPRFINGWLNRARESARASPARRQTPAPRQDGHQSAGHSGGGYARPPSYDIRRAMEEMKTTVPTLKKKEKRDPTPVR